MGLLCVMLTLLELCRLTEIHLSLPRTDIALISKPLPLRVDTYLILLPGSTLHAIKSGFDSLFSLVAWARKNYHNLVRWGIPEVMARLLQRPQHQQWPP